MENLKLDSFLEYKFLSNLDLNPDGSKAAFTVSTANIDKNSYNKSIWLFDTEKNTTRKLTQLNNEKNSFWLDKNSLIFSAERDEKIKEKIKNFENWSSFYLLDLENGGEAEKYMDIPLNVSAIKKIDEDFFILTATYDNNEIDFNSLNEEDKKNAIKKKNEDKDYEIIDEIPFWSNGVGFINKKRNRLYSFRKSTNKIQAITDELTNVESFKIKNNKILIISEKHLDKMGVTNSLAEYDLNNNKYKVLIEENLYSISFADYIEDKIICCLSDMKNYGINENHKIFIYENNNLTLLYDNDTWLSSTVGSDCRLGSGKSLKVLGDELYFLTTLNDASVIAKLDLNGNVEILTDREGSVDCFDIVDKNKIFYIGMKNYKLQEIYKVGREENLTNFNSEINNKYKISVPEKIIFETNGDKTEGFVIKPINFEENKKYPAILDIHGGPKTVYGKVFYHEMQVWANMGYFVFFCNPHGSDGKGNKFADIRGKYGTIDYEDILNWTKYVSENFSIDKNKIGVTGGSYGGFMTNWIIGHTDIFKCAVSQRSISNWISKFGTTDIGYYFNADQNNSTPWENHDKLWWHSPLKYANNVKTPTLFIHSEEDYRCWLAEGIQMFTALKYHGVEARLCMFRGENHELSRSGKPKHRIKRLSEITNWFEKYLK